MLAACGSADGSSGKQAVVAAFYPLAFAAQRIGGDSVSVENVTPVGAEPHDLELTPKTVARIQSANVVLYLGDEFQPAVSEAAREGSGRAIDLLPQDGDPHVWLDPIRFAQLGRTIGAALHRPTRAFTAELERLDREYHRGLAHCARREIVTSHEAFGYLARRYGLKQVAVTGIAPEAEPSPRRLAQVVRTVKRTRATTVFFERLVSPRLAETVAREVGARTAVLDPIEGAEPGQTYVSLMRRNLAALRKALGCR